MLGVIYLFSAADKLNVTRTNVSLNELVSNISSQKIKKVVVKPDSIIGVIDNKNELVTKKETNISFFETLKYYEVPTTTLQKLDIKFEENTD